MNIAKLIEGLSSRSEAERREMRAKAEGWLNSGDPNKEAAARELLSALDLTAAAAAEAFERTPLGDRVVLAFSRQPWSDHERKLIQVLLDHPASTTTELNRLAGLGDNMVWQMHFGNMCKDRSAHLGSPPAAVTREGLFWSGLLADAAPETNRFTMKPDAVAGFAKLGLKATR